MKAIIGSLFLDANNDFILIQTVFYNDDGTIVEDATQSFGIHFVAAQDQVTFRAAVLARVTAYAVAHSYTVTDYIWAVNLDGILSGPSSYQTIVSQTGTSAPAVSGGFTPASTYAGGVTFTWARTAVGVYTLTASSAVFAAGKTGVFVAPLQNLNGSIRAVVTSTTVITVTTAVQSLAVLGLLGFTATNTDALLNGTMVYVQTYA